MVTGAMNPDFVDLLRAFGAADVRFLIVGAYALAVHGRPRATGDLDVWIDATPENAERVMRSLAAFGAPLAEIAEDDFTRPGGRVPPGRIDILTELTGVAFGRVARSHSTAIRRAPRGLHRPGHVLAQQASDRPVERPE